ncbi:ATP-binding protein [Halobellus salinus]|uniref:sensor histidine kinase n=1 Tax=Halobellus salinus TaxID=931585 RepID=UPI00227C2216|nr:ATP-binding protein [Halobellus salinus]SMP11903.1 Signal transduction histidine kinase [Halobellus salinus]
MSTGGTTQLAYILGHVLTALVSLTVGYWIVFQTDMRARRLYGVYALSNTIWSIVSVFLVVAPTGSLLLTLRSIWGTIPMFSAIPLVAFTAKFTGRNWRQNNTVRAVTIAAIIVSPFVLTAQFHNLYWQSVTFYTEPFAHIMISYEIMWFAAVLIILSAFLVSYYYFIELYLKSRHRPSSALILIVTGFLLGLTPFVLSRLRLGLVPTYDHTAFGIIFPALSFVFAAQRLQLADVTPLARDEAIEDLADPYIAIDATARLVDYNPAAETLLDISGSDIGDKIAEIAPAVATAIQHGEDELTLSSDGTPRHFDLTISPISGPVADQLGTQLLMREVTAREERKSELALQNEQLNRFASVVSHDLRNPLGVIIGRVRLLDGTTNDQDDIDAIERSAVRMENIMTDLLELSRAGQSIDETEPVSLASVAADSWDKIQQNGTELDMQVPESVTVEADRDRLMHIFENLFRNAKEHNEPPLTIRTGVIPSETANKDDKSFISFFIEDNGDGVPADDCDEIFDHGYTTNPDGTGFGLSIVEEVVDAHGWSISVSDSDDGGARFEITDIETGN